MTSQTTRRLTNEEYRTLLETANDASVRQGFTIHLLGHTGLTRSEAAGFTKEWFDPEQQRVTVPREDGDFSTMTEARAREIPLQTPAAETLHKYLEQLPEKALNVVPATITYRVKKTGQSADINHVSPRVLRRTYGQRLNAIGVPIEHLERILGHRSNRWTGPPRNLVDLDEFSSLYNSWGD